MVHQDKVLKSGLLRSLLSWPIAKNGDCRSETAIVNNVPSNSNYCSFI